ncbi:MAG: putative DNA binding domain-containing protein [Muribaculaceae bacterium]|nr:putative DNA binding domain-containing protein [Muribaculaceae bacterium]
MMKSSHFSLKELKTYKENSRLEVKSARGGLPSSLWESYSAFANSDGGVIVLGVKENRDGSFFVEGLGNSHKLIKDFWNAVNNRQKVSCNILTDSMAYLDSVDGKDVIVIHVPRAERTSRPVYVGADPRTGTYRRNGEGDYHCSIEEVSLMIRDSALVTDDNKILTEFGVNVFCAETVKAYRNIFRLVRQKHLWNNEDDTMFLRRIGAVREDKDSGKFHPTVAGLLMFGFEYDITTVFPNYFLDYQENRTNGIYARWTDRLTSQSGDWSGNVFDFLLKIVQKLQSDLKVPFMFKGNVRDEDTPLHKTVREAAVNMLANADFYGRRGVVVQKGADGFTFANPGSMRVSLKEALQDSASDPRNGVMMKMLAMVEYGERAGSGLQGIFKTWESVYHCSPKLEVTTSGGVDRTILSLDFKGHIPDVDAMKRLYGNYGDPYVKDDACVLREGVVAYGSNDIVNDSKGDVAKNDTVNDTVNINTDTVSDTVKNFAGCVVENDTVSDTVNINADTVSDAVNDTVNDTARLILQCIIENPKITYEGIVKRTTIPRATVARNISKLKVLGYIIRHDADKNGYWEVSKNF